MKNALIIRGFGAIGDMIFISQAPRLIKNKGYGKVSVLASNDNKFVFDNNPFVDEILDYDQYKDNDYNAQIDKWKRQFDIFDFTYTVEERFLFKSHLETNHGIEQRRRNAKGKNYYLESLMACGLDTDKAKGELYLNDAEKEVVEGLKKTHFKIVLWNISGSTKNKILLYAPKMIKAFLAQDDNLHHYLVNSGSLTNIGLPEDKRIHDIGGQIDSRLAMVMTAGSDLVIGPESMLVNAAGCFDTAILCFLSHSSHENLLGGFQKALSIKPKCDCSPCYIIPTDFRQFLDLRHRASARNQELFCTRFSEQYSFDPLGFKCCTDIDFDDAMNKAKELLYE